MSGEHRRRTIIIDGGLPAAPIDPELLDWLNKQSVTRLPNRTAAR